MDNAGYSNIQHHVDCVPHEQIPALTIIVGMVMGILFAYFYFRARVELAARKIGDEIGERVFERKKAVLESLFDEKYRALLDG